jgi:hypothetical protein
VPVNRVVAEIRFTTDKPLGEWWLTEIADFSKRLHPINVSCLFSPECITVTD